MNLISKMIPIWLKKYIKNFSLRISTMRAYYMDYKRFYRSQKNKKSVPNKKRLESLIFYHAHSLEKGMTNVNFRVGFGKNALNQLIRSLNLYAKAKYPTNTTAYLSGNAVLSAYQNIHLTYGYKDDDVDKYLSLLPSSSVNERVNGGTNEEKFNQINNQQFNYFDFVKTRKSIRDFGDKKIDNSLIDQALESAAFTPSVCNRQPWGTKIVIDKQKIDAILSIQKGFKNYGSNLTGLIVIYSEIESMLSINERNQHFIDCGMYSMSILLSLKSLNIAACALNASLDFKSEQMISKICNIGINTRIIMFIAYGSFPTTYKTCVSMRKYTDETREYI